MPGIGVVHLVRQANGWEPFDRFLTSYEAHPAGIEHDLVAVLKGFPAEGAPDRFLERLAPHGGKVLALEDVGFDIGSYWAAARRLDYPRLCFLNSFSVILDDGWLSKLAQHHKDSVGVAGATGSWESHRQTTARSSMTGILLPPWRPATPPLPARRLTVRDRAWLFKTLLQVRREFPGFPNPHIRTNAFLIHRALMQEIEVGDLTTKQTVFAVESGRRSLTRQIQDRGLEILVVGRDGVAYPPEEWPRSDTFRSGDQGNLLVSDNRTREWAAMSPVRRHQYSTLTWGRSAAEVSTASS